ncbi:MAG: LysR family transcriptional regulator [Nitrospira sp. OLB3]|nr:MAG: LysR family transcriptional regulator [Nitrospira sp. OLB3]
MSSWDGIDEFIAVASAGSFRRGAEAIGMSPTHVSRAIMALEERVQAQLLHRTTRTVRLTDTGRTFFELCERIAQERDEAIAHIGEGGEPQGELRVTCSTAMGERFVAPLIRRFAMRHPKLSVSIELTNRVVDLVAEGFDLGIRTGSISDLRLIGTQVASRKLYTCAAPAYLARRDKPRCVEDLADHECLIGTSGSWRFKVDGEQLEHRPKGRFRCNSGHAVMEACIAGLGICQLPDFYILPHLGHGMVELLLEPFQPDEEPIWAVYPRRRHLVPKIQSMIVELERELGPGLNPGNAFRSK